MYILYYMRWQKLYTVHTYIKCNPYVARMTAHACNSMYRACALFYPSCLFTIVFIDRSDRFSLGRKNVCNSFFSHIMHIYIYLLLFLLHTWKISRIKNSFSYCMIPAREISWFWSEIKEHGERNGSLINKTLLQQPCQCNIVCENLMSMRAYLIH